MRKIILPIIIIASASCNLATQHTSEPVSVIAPESKPSGFETNDSSFLKLKVKGNKFEIDFLSNTSVVDNVNELDTFFQNNKEFINKEKIMVIDFDTLQNNKGLTDLLKKHGVSKFSIAAGKNH